MQVTETLKDGLKRAYTITVSAAELEAKVQEKLLEAQPEVEIKGFPQGQSAAGDPEKAIRSAPDGRCHAGRH